MKHNFRGFNTGGSTIQDTSNTCTITSYRSFLSHIFDIVCGFEPSCEISLGLTRVRKLMTSRHDVMVSIFTKTSIHKFISLK